VARLIPIIGVAEDIRRCAPLQPGDLGWWWDPLRYLTTVAEANRLAGHFVATVEDDRRDIWGPAAKEVLATLLLAAAVGGKSLVDVYEWLANEATPVPGGLLREHGYDLLARTLRGTQDSPQETRGSVYFTARAATACLRDPQITAWVTDPANSANRSNGAVGTKRPDGAAGSLVEFRPEQFPTSRQTLYLLSKDEGGSAGPLVAALTDRVLRCGVVAAERRGGRLDPPMVLVLDEAANICRISDLPSLYSHLGSRGVVPLTILQSYSQAVGVWGETGTKALWATRPSSSSARAWTTRASPRTCPASSATTTFSPSAVAAAAVGAAAAAPLPRASSASCRPTPSASSPAAGRCCWLLVASPRS